MSIWSLATSLLEEIAREHKLNVEIVDADHVDGGCGSTPFRLKVSAAEPGGHAASTITGPLAAEQIVPALWGIQVGAFQMYDMLRHRLKP